MKRPAEGGVQRQPAAASASRAAHPALLQRCPPQPNGKREESFQSTESAITETDTAAEHAENILSYSLKHSAATCKAPASTALPGQPSAAGSLHAPRPPALVRSQTPPRQRARARGTAAALAAPALSLPAHALHGSCIHFPEHHPLEAGWMRRCCGGTEWCHIRKLNPSNLPAAYFI